MQGHDPAVGQVGRLGQGEKVAATEGAAVVPVASGVAVAALECHFVEGAMLGFLLPDRGLHQADADALDGRSGFSFPVAISSWSFPFVSGRPECRFRETDRAEADKRPVNELRGRPQKGRMDRAEIDRLRASARVHEWNRTRTEEGKREEKKPNRETGKI